MVRHQDEDDFDVSDDDSMIDRLICERNDVRVRVNTMKIIKNLPITNVDLPNNVLSRLPIKINSVVSSLTDSSGRISVRLKGGRIKSTIDMI